MTTVFQSDLPRGASPWLLKNSEAIRNDASLNAGEVFDWEGNIWDVEEHSIKAPTDPKAAVIPDFGLQVGEKPPSVVIISCWKKHYQQKFKELQLWMSKGPQTQSVLFLTWNIIKANPKDIAKLDLHVESYDFDASQPNKYKLRSQESVSTATDPKGEVTRPTRYGVSASLCFSGKPPVGAKDQWYLDVGDLWEKAVQAFKTEVARQPEAISGTDDSPAQSSSPGVDKPVAKPPTEVIKPPTEVVKPPTEVVKPPTEVVKPPPGVAGAGAHDGSGLFGSVVLPTGYTPCGLYGAYSWGGFLVYIALAKPISGITSLTQDQILAHLSQSTQNLQSLAGSITGAGSKPLGQGTAVSGSGHTSGAQGNQSKPPPGAILVNETTNQDGSITQEYEIHTQIPGKPMKVPLPTQLITLEQVQQSTSWITIGGYVFDLSKLVPHVPAATDLCSLVSQGHGAAAAAQFVQKFSVETITKFIFNHGICIGQVQGQSAQGIMLEIISTVVTTTQTQIEKITITNHPSQNVGAGCGAFTGGKPVVQPSPTGCGAFTGGKPVVQPPPTGLTPPVQGNPGNPTLIPAQVGASNPGNVPTNPGLLGQVGTTIVNKPGTNGITVGAGGIIVGPGQTTHLPPAGPDGLQPWQPGLSGSFTGLCPANPVSPPPVNGDTSGSIVQQPGGPPLVSGGGSIAPTKPQAPIVTWVPGSGYLPNPQSGALAPVLIAPTKPEAPTVTWVPGSGYSPNPQPGAGNNTGTTTTGTGGLTLVPGQIGSGQIGSGQLGSGQLGSGQIGSGGHETSSGHTGSGHTGSGQIGLGQINLGQIGLGSGSTSVTHTTTCSIHNTSSGGFVICNCGGSSAHGAGTSTGDSNTSLMTQLQAILIQLQAQNGGKPIRPVFNVNMSCEVTQSESEEMVVELNVRYRGQKTSSHVHAGWCQQTRNVLGATGNGVCQFAALH